MDFKPRFPMIEPIIYILLMAPFLVSYFLPGMELFMIVLAPMALLSLILLTKWTFVNHCPIWPDGEKGYYMLWNNRIFPRVAVPFGTRTENLDDLHCPISVFEDFGESIGKVLLNVLCLLTVMFVFYAIVIYLEKRKSIGKILPDDFTSFYMYSLPSMFFILLLFAIMWNFTQVNTGTLITGYNSIVKPELSSLGTDLDKAIEQVETSIETSLTYIEENV